MKLWNNNLLEAQAMQKDAREEDVPKASVQPSTKVQPRAMEIDMNVLGAIEAKRCTTIMDRITFLNKSICILDPIRFMWIQTKQNYNKHVERMEDWKDISEEEEWASKVGLVILFLMNWEALMSDVIL